MAEQLTPDEVDELQARIYAPQRAIDPGNPADVQTELDAHQTSLIPRGRFQTSDRFHWQAPGRDDRMNTFGALSDHDELNDRSRTLYASGGAVERDEDNLDREHHDNGNDYDPVVAQDVRQRVTRLCEMMENQGVAGVMAIKRYAKALEVAADCLNDDNAHLYGEAARELCEALYEVRMRCLEERRKR